MCGYFFKHPPKPVGGGCAKMGQPTSGTLQRVGQTQLWQHVSMLSKHERGYGEHQFKLTLAARLGVLFFQSLLLPPGGHL